MANQLRDLIIDEVSLVEAPANAEIDPRTGTKTSRATVAIFKRDNTVEPPKETKMLTLKQIRKSDNLVFSRESIAQAVHVKALKVAAKRGISIEKAELRVWQKNPIVQALYDSAPVPILKRESRTAMVTEAEGELDRRARKRMQQFGENYAKACKNVLEEDPGLYTRYETERANGATYAVPEPAEYLGMPDHGNKMDVTDYVDDDDDDGDENSMYARRPQATTTDSMTTQERKGEKMRR